MSVRLLVTGGLAILVLAVLALVFAYHRSPERTPVPCSMNTATSVKPGEHADLATGESDSSRQAHNRRADESGSPLDDPKLPVGVIIAILAESGDISVYPNATLMGSLGARIATDSDGAVALASTAECIALEAKLREETITAGDYTQWKCIATRVQQAREQPKLMVLLARTKDITVKVAGADQRPLCGVPLRVTSLELTTQLRKDGWRPIRSLSAVSVSNMHGEAQFDEVWICEGVTLECADDALAHPTPSLPIAVAVDSPLLIPVPKELQRMSFSVKDVRGASIDNADVYVGRQRLLLDAIGDFSAWLDGAKCEDCVLAYSAVGLAPQWIKLKEVVDSQIPCQHDKALIAGSEHLEIRGRIHLPIEARACDVHALLSQGSNFFGPPSDVICNLRHRSLGGNARLSWINADSSFVARGLNALTWDLLVAARDGTWFAIAEDVPGGSFDVEISTEIERTPIEIQFVDQHGAELSDVEATLRLLGACDPPYEWKVQTAKQANGVTELRIPRSSWFNLECRVNRGPVHRSSAMTLIQDQLNRVVLERTFTVIIKNAGANPIRVMAFLDGRGDRCGVYYGDGEVATFPVDLMPDDARPFQSDQSTGRIEWLTCPGGDLRNSQVILNEFSKTTLTLGER